MALPPHELITERNLLRPLEAVEVEDPEITKDFFPVFTSVNIHLVVNDGCCVSRSRGRLVLQVVVDDEGARLRFKDSDVVEEILADCFPAKDVKPVLVSDSCMSVPWREVDVSVRQRLRPRRLLCVEAKHLPECFVLRSSANNVDLIIVRRKCMSVSSRSERRSLLEEHLLIDDHELRRRHALLRYLPAEDVENVVADEAAA